MIQHHSNFGENTFSELLNKLSKTSSKSAFIAIDMHKRSFK